MRARPENIGWEKGRLLGGGGGDAGKLPVAEGTKDIGTRVHHDVYMYTYTRVIPRVYLRDRR